MPDLTAYRPGLPYLEANPGDLFTEGCPPPRERANRPALLPLAAMATHTSYTEVEPLSPDPPGWGSNYTPSKDTPNGRVEIVGRRQARILHGQDPQKNPEMFTPQVDLTKVKWPTNEEAELWAAAVFSKPKKQKKLELHNTPAVGGGTANARARRSPRCARRRLQPAAPLALLALSSLSSSRQRSEVQLSSHGLSSHVSALVSDAHTAVECIVLYTVLSCLQLTVKAL